jgi:ubiquinone/menaquinone biosynthesis C-methylase UbiE
MEPEEIRKMSEIEGSNWWFCGKRYLVRSHMKKGKVILDVGCGTGANLKSFSGAGIVVGTDLSMEALKFCRSRVINPLVKCSADRLPFKSGSIDTVTALDVLEHLDKDKKSMDEINRVLKLKGTLIATVPAHMFLWHRHDILLHHKRRYSINEFKTKLLSSGFDIKKVSYWNFTLFPLAAMYKFLNNDSDTNRMNPVINTILYFLLTIDNILIKMFRLPFGVSIFCVARKV